MKFIYIPVFTLLKKEIQEIWKLIRHRGRTPRYKDNKDLFIGGDPRKQSTAMAPEQAIICLNNSLHASKAAKPAPLTATVPEKPSKSEAATSDHTDSKKNTPEGESSTCPLWYSEEEFQAPR